jgi:hypothetical protein
MSNKKHKTSTVVQIDDKNQNLDQFLEEVLIYY